MDEETDEVTEKESIPVNAALGQTVLYELDTPIKGEVIPLSKVSDTAFSTGLLGQGVAILPTEGKVYAPADGKVTTLFPTYHALGLTTDEGIELLIHIGMDTVNLQGKYFDPAVKQGDTVRKGQLLLIFDIDAIAAAGYSLQTPVIIANSKHYLEVVSSEEKNVNISNNLFTVIA